jgi:hypothetical protein
VSEGIRASGRPPGQIAKRWLATIERIEERLRGRVRRGRTLALGGRVLSLDVAPGTVYADVEDGETVRPTIRVRPYDESEWQRVVEVLQQRLDLLAMLVEGDVDDALIQALQDKGVHLFPKRSELEGDCDCGDYAVPCAHGAAVHYVLAEALDGEPMLLFALRGRPREQLLGDLRRAWGDHSAPPKPHTISDEAPPSGDWFRSPKPLPTMTFRIPPSLDAKPGLLELGPLAGDEDLLRTLGPLYDAGAEAALELALAELSSPSEPRKRRARAPGSTAPEALVVEQEPAPPAPAPVREPTAAAEDDDEAPAELSERLVDLIASADEGVKARDLALQLGVDMAVVRRELKDLEAMGVVARTGATRGTRWWLG